MKSFISDEVLNRLIEANNEAAGMIDPPTIKRVSSTIISIVLPELDPINATIVSNE